MKRREFLTKALQTAAGASLGTATLDTLPEIKAEPAPYPDAARTAVMDEWERIFDQTIVKLEKACGNLVDARAKAPVEVDAVGLHDSIESAYEAIERLVSQMDRMEFDEMFYQVTERKNFWVHVESELNKPGCDFDWLAREIEFISRDHPEEGRRLRKILDERRRA